MPTPPSGSARLGGLAVRETHPTVWVEIAGVPLRLTHPTVRVAARSWCALASVREVSQEEVFRGSDLSRSISA